MNYLLSGRAVTATVRTTVAVRLREWRDGQGAGAQGRRAEHARRGTTTTSRTPSRPAWSSSGTEVKSLRQGRASLVDGFADIDGGEAWLHGVHIPEYTQGTWTNHAARRKRKLLLNRDEIDKIERQVNEKGLTLVPLSLYFMDGRAKVEIALAKGKKS